MREKKKGKSPVYFDYQNLKEGTVVLLFVLSYRSIAFRASAFSGAFLKGVKS